MKIEVESKSFATCLAKMKPNRKMIKEKEPIEIIATDNVVMLIGSLDSSAAVEAKVISPGRGHLPLEPVLRVLKIYKKDTTIQLQIEGGFFWVDKMKFKLETK